MHLWYNANIFTFLFFILHYILYLYDILYLYMKSFLTIAKAYKKKIQPDERRENTLNVVGSLMLCF